jgi:hypothetical protein
VISSKVERQRKEGRSKGQMVGRNECGGVKKVEGKDSEMGEGGGRV